MVCRQVAEREGNIVLVGDGMTDFEVTESGVDFIGFGGVVKRESVRHSAPRYIEDATLLPVLDYVLA